MQIYNLLKKLIQFYTYNPGDSLFSITDTDWSASYFDLTQTRNIKQIKTYGNYRTADTVTTLNIEVRNDNSGVPGSTIHYSYSFDISNWPNVNNTTDTIDEIYDVDMSLSAAKYWLVFYTNSSSEYAYFTGDDSQSVDSEDSGSTWNDGQYDYGPHFSLYD